VNLYRRERSTVTEVTDAVVRIRIVGFAGRLCGMAHLGKAGDEPRIGTAKIWQDQGRGGRTLSSQVMKTKTILMKRRRNSEGVSAEGLVALLMSD
jgi:hypothetical protein